MRIISRLSIGKLPGRTKHGRRRVAPRLRRWAEDATNAVAIVLDDYRAYPTSLFSRSRRSSAAEVA